MPVGPAPIAPMLNAVDYIQSEGRMPAPKRESIRWTDEETKLILKLKRDGKGWTEIESYFPERTSGAIKLRYRNVTKIITKSEQDKWQRLKALPFSPASDEELSNETPRSCDLNANEVESQSSESPGCHQDQMDRFLASQDTMTDKRKNTGSQPSPQSPQPRKKQKTSEEDYPIAAGAQSRTSDEATGNILWNLTSGETDTISDRLLQPPRVTSGNEANAATKIFYFNSETCTPRQLICVLLQSFSAMKAADQGHKTSGPKWKPELFLVLFNSVLSRLPDIYRERQTLPESWAKCWSDLIRYEFTNNPPPNLDRARAILVAWEKLSNEKDGQRLITASANLSRVIVNDDSIGPPAIVANPDGSHDTAVKSISAQRNSIATERNSETCTEQDTAGSSGAVSSRTQPVAVAMNGEQTGCLQDSVHESHASGLQRTASRSPIESSHVSETTSTNLTEGAARGQTLVDDQQIPASISHQSQTDSENQVSTTDTVQQQASTAEDSPQNEQRDSERADQTVSASTATNKLNDSASRPIDLTTLAQNELERRERSAQTHKSQREGHAELIAKLQQKGEEELEEKRLKEETEKALEALLGL